MGMLTILHVSDVHYRASANPDQHRVAQALIEAAHYHTRESLKDIRELVENGELEQVIVQLRLRSKYPELLLTALVLSQNESDWDEAERFLPSIGTPFHYLCLGYSAWSEGDSRKAIKFSEEALAQAEKNPTGIEDSRSLIAKVKNNLAYYYAETADESKMSKALAFAKEAVAATENDAEQKTIYANLLDTLGFVQITFAQSRSQVEEGITTCENARRNGAELPLYLKHIALAEAQLTELH